MVFNTTFNNISIISRQSVLLVEETDYLKKTKVLSQVTDKLYHIMLYWVHLTWAGFELTTLVVIGTDCDGSYVLITALHDHNKISLLKVMTFTHNSKENTLPYSNLYNVLVPVPVLGQLSDLEVLMGQTQMLNQLPEEICLLILGI